MDLVLSSQYKIGASTRVIKVGEIDKLPGLDIPITAHNPKLDTGLVLDLREGQKEN